MQTQHRQKKVKKRERDKERNKYKGRTNTSPQEVFFFFLNVGREIKRYFIYSFKKKVRKFSENMQDKSK